VNGGNGGGGGNGGSGPSGFSSVGATDIGSQTLFGRDDTQEFTFTLNESLANDETVTINFDEAQGLRGSRNEFPDPADYRSADISDSFSSLSGGTATIAATEGTASITYQANRDVPTGTTIEILVYDFDTEGQSTDTVSVSFNRSDGTTESTTFSVD
jgi:hypothetical protein